MFGSTLPLLQPCVPLVRHHIPVLNRGVEQSMNTRLDGDHQTSPMHPMHHALAAAAGSGFRYAQQHTTDIALLTAPRPQHSTGPRSLVTCLARPQQSIFWPAAAQPLHLQDFGKYPNSAFGCLEKQPHYSLCNNILFKQKGN